MENVLEVKDLCKSFSTGSVQQHVLKNLNIQIHKGDFSIIMGSSGSGKSTLLYALSGMDRPTLGDIRYGAEEISKYSNDKPYGRHSDVKDSRHLLQLCCR